jgi:hypothetical protein
MGVGSEHHAPAALPPTKRPSTHCTGGWVGLGVGLDMCGKSRPHRDSIARPSSRQRVHVVLVWIYCTFNCTEDNGDAALFTPYSDDLINYKVAKQPNSDRGRQAIKEWQRSPRDKSDRGHQAVKKWQRSLSKQRVREVTKKSKWQRSPSNQKMIEVAKQPTSDRGR